MLGPDPVPIHTLGTLLATGEAGIPEREENILFIFVTC